VVPKVTLAGEGSDEYGVLDYEVINDKILVVKTGIPKAKSFTCGRELCVTLGISNGVYEVLGTSRFERTNSLCVNFNVLAGLKFGMAEVSDRELILKGSIGVSEEKTGGLVLTAREIMKTVRMGTDSNWITLWV